MSSNSRDIDEETFDAVPISKLHRRARAESSEMSPLSPLRTLSPLVISRQVAPSNPPTFPDNEENLSANALEGREMPFDEEAAERARREDEESIALARALMAEEAMAVSYRMSMDYLRHNRDQFSEEDLAALQAAMEDDEDDINDGDLPGDGMSYELMLRLGEQIGDVKSERWSRIAREKIEALPTFEFDHALTKEKDENDSDVKCLVCQFQYEDKECLRRLPCGHCFHAECIDQWLLGKNVCPYCRKTIVDE